MADHSVETTPQVYIDGERIGGFDALRAYLGHEVKAGARRLFSRSSPSLRSPLA